ncbi:MAG: IclR family transcriptional regulator [Deinococcales bacterium]
MNEKSTRVGEPKRRAAVGRSGAAQPQLNRSLQKALAVLECFTELRPDWGVSELSRATGIAKSSVSTTMATLAAAGMLRQDRATRRYQLGLRCLELGYLASSRMVLRDFAAPHLEELLGHDERIAYLAIPYGFELLYLDAVHPPKRKINYSSQGRRAPLYCTGLGKAVLAYMDDDFVDAFFSAVPLVGFTENTICDSQELRDELALIRERGYATDRQEREVGIQCVAAPVIGGDGSVVAAISLSGSKQAVPSTDFERLGQAVVDTAKGITRKLIAAGYQPAQLGS